MECQPAQTSSSCFASRDVAMIFVMSSRLRHLSFSGQYLPLPYMPSIAAPRRVSSAASAGSAGAAAVSESFRSFSFRAVSGSTLRPSKRVACLAYCDPGRDRLLVGHGRQDLGVVGDVGRLDPVRPAGLDPELEEVLLGVADELPGLFRRWGLCGGRGRLGMRVSGHEASQQQTKTGREAGVPTLHEALPNSV